MTSHLSEVATDALPPSITAPTSISTLQPVPSVQTNQHSMQTRSKSGISKPISKFCYKAVIDYTFTEPPTYKIASTYPKWCEAMDAEFQALQRQQTWSLVPAPPNVNLVGCKWVFKLKLNSDGSISRYKARLVAKGFHQQAGIDYHETFSPVIKPATVRLILAIAVSCNWSLRQLDVSNAFLHGLLKEEVYMTQPPGYMDSHHPSYVCKLHKSLYGLKQAPRAWFERFTFHLLHLGFTASMADSSLFIFHSSGTIIYLLLYVDDIIVTGNNSAQISSFIAALSQVFELKDLGPLSYFLGIQISPTKYGITLTQSKYASDILHRFNMSNSKPVKTPCCPATRLVPHTGVSLADPTEYRSLVGALQYLTFTRPDLAFSVQQLCQFMSKPTSTHMEAAKRVLRYVRGTLHHGICFSPGPLTLTAFSDADWAGDPTDRRSTTGLLVFLGPNPISWSAKKQSTVSRSSTEAEYRALATSAAELSWLRILFKELNIYLPYVPVIWCDNISAIALSANPVFHSRTKHLEVDYHFVREKVLRKDLCVGFISGADNFADVFTKPLSAPPFLLIRSKLLVDSSPKRLRGDVEEQSQSQHDQQDSTQDSIRTVSLIT